MSSTNAAVRRETNRRRTFAIISHPDSGKTTLTEKLLLFGGQIEVAGAVRGRKTQRSATSDWMEIERQRGISVSSTVLSFEFGGCLLNLLDTPGHHDFSEDTFRTLVAADSAIMVIDLAKGVESQTKKLFRVCALRKIPILTFVNKVDRPGKQPLEILAEIEAELGVKCSPQNWPLGYGADFRGIVDLNTGIAHLFEERRGDRRLQGTSVPLDEVDETLVSAEALAQAREEIELLGDANRLDREEFLAAAATPVFFGSALTNHGVEAFLRSFIEIAPAPGPREADVGLVPVDREDLGAFVFKIQANLDPKHRDCIAFVRVCAGRFARDMEVTHARTGKKIRLRRVHRVFGSERETVEEAYPGDIVGLVNPGEFRLGDTLCTGDPLHYAPLPAFAPEKFAAIRCTSSTRRKQFAKGMEQLLGEGAIQTFNDPKAATKEPILAAVGELQFDVVRYRLQSEYDVETALTWLPFVTARWVSGPGPLEDLRLPYASRLVYANTGHAAVLFSSEWDLKYAKETNAAYRFDATRAGDLSTNTNSASARPL